MTIRSTTFGASKDLAVSVLSASTAGLPSNTGRPVDPSAAAAHFDPDSIVLLAETPSGAAGLTMIAPSAQPGVWQTQATGVPVAYRGRGVARALKLAGLRYARAAGGERMETQNDSRNTAILALNASVGMEPTVGFWTFVRP